MGNRKRKLFKDYIRRGIVFLLALIMVCQNTLFAFAQIEYLADAADAGNNVETAEMTDLLSVGTEEATEVSIEELKEVIKTYGALHVAVKYPKIVKLLIEADPSLINIRNAKRRTALVEAACIGKVDVVNMLIDAGTYINTSNKWGDIALIEMVKCNNISSYNNIFK